MQRVNSIDIVRGLVIMLMALDHTRDFWGMTDFAPEDPLASNPGWFFTRWITHFCAPVFIFLSGTSAWLYGRKVADKNKLAKFLLIRGIWLILAEALLVNPGWTFLFPWQSGTIMLQVIWVLGWSMIVLAGLIYLDWRLILGISLFTIGIHNCFDLDTLNGEQTNWFIKFLHIPFAHLLLFNDPKVVGITVYPLIPWFAVMSLGYVCGKLYQDAPEKRKRILVGTGVLALLLFLILRSWNIYGDSNLWLKQQSSSSTVLDYLDVSKYPPSLLYLCVTLGIAAILLAWAESWKGKAAEIIMIYGQVPFFFYLIHTPILNLGARIYHYVRYGRAFTFVGSEEAWPQDYKPQLWLVYAVWIILLFLLYFLCRWYGNFKRSHSYWWLKYL